MIPPQREAVPMKLCSYCAGQMDRRATVCTSCGKGVSEGVQLSAEETTEEPRVIRVKRPRHEATDLENPWLGKVMSRVVLVGLLFFLVKLGERVLQAVVMTGTFGAGPKFSQTVQAVATWLQIGVLLLAVAVGYEFIVRFLIAASSGPPRTSKKADDVPDQRQV